MPCVCSVGSWPWICRINVRRENHTPEHVRSVQNDTWMQTTQSIWRRHVDTVTTTRAQHARREHNTRDENTTRATRTQHARSEHNTRDENTTRATWARREHKRDVRTTRANSHSACKTRKLERRWRRRVDAVIWFSVALLISVGRKAWHTSAHLPTSLVKEEDEVVSGAEEEERKRAGKEHLEMKRLTHLLRRSSVRSPKKCVSGAVELVAKSSFIWVG